MMRAIYPGSFDPITNGHIDIIIRASKLFDELRIAVGGNILKNSVFSIDERVELIEASLRSQDVDISKIIVEKFDSLLIDYAKKVNADVIIRGLRAVSDYEYELQMALANKEMNENIETIFLVSSGKYSYLSSSLVKEIAYFEGDLDNFVPDVVKKNLRNKFQ
ncbi:MAG: pantetheine-phosphate adenylyltransferase [Firmicutes bacterium]|nr:pantetheine-phosphate adenylyltransferase [Ezakiella sp.]MDD7761999.1 pantetheine-phosphate adenylyltransferase [Bacillota bacterium]